MRNVILNMEEFARGKLTKMQMLVEGRQSVVLLDSCSSASIITKEFLTNHLNRTEEDLIGPVGSIKGIGDTITRDLGRIRLRLTIWNRVYVEEFIVIDNAGIPDVLISATPRGFATSEAICCFCFHDNLNSFVTNTHPIYSFQEH